jgi:hypothetical protein
LPMKTVNLKAGEKWEAKMGHCSFVAYSKLLQDICLRTQ